MNKRSKLLFYLLGIQFIIFSISFIIPLFLLNNKLPIYLLGILINFIVSFFIFLMFFKRDGILFIDDYDDKTYYKLLLELPLPEVLSKTILLIEVNNKKVLRDKNEPYNERLSSKGGTIR